MITVVIPYYQKNPGILARALSSIKAQESCGMPVHVIVVDDASPIPAKGEVDGLGDLPFSIEVIRQENTGPGGARNTALDNAPQGTRYIAFLDSDDEWDSSHLRRAILALMEGYDFYFSNLYHLEQNVGAFERAGRLELSAHLPLNVLENGLYAFKGDMLDQIIRGNVIGTPTVVYDFVRWPDQRFQIEYTHAGEDYLFWMAFAKTGAKIAFSSQCEVKCGRGVNVYSGSGWGTEHHLLRIHNELKYRKATMRLYILTADQAVHLKHCIEDLRISFARDLLHRLVHGKTITFNLMKAHFWLDPLNFVKTPIYWVCFFLKNMQEK